MAEAEAPRARRVARAVGSMLAIAMLAGAVVLVALRWDDISRQVNAARGRAWSPSDLGLVIALLALAAVNVALSGAFFRILLSRFGRVGLVEMQAVVAAATLINYLPLRPGLFARVAYHKRVNDIAVAHSVRVVFEAIAIGLAGTAYLLAAVAISSRMGAAPWLWIAAPVPCLLALLAWSPARVFAAAALVRYAEILIWALRLALAYAVLGVDITPLGAVACAAIVIVTTLVPFVSNGLGLTEWTMGALAPALAGADLELGVVAQLVSRGAEMIMITMLGVPAFVWTSRRLGRRSPA